MSTVFACVAAALVGLRGVAHAIPTHRVVAGFEPITVDNRQVIVQEWPAEAFTMLAFAALVVTVTVVDAGGDTTSWVYRVVALLLVALGILTALTGCLHACRVVRDLPGAARNLSGVAGAGQRQLTRGDAAPIGLLTVGAPPTRQWCCRRRRRGGSRSTT